MPFDGTVTSRKPVVSDRHARMLDQELGILRQAREQLARPDAWVQGHFYVSEGRATPGACAVGHMIMAAEGPNFFHGLQPWTMPYVVERVAEKYYPGGRRALMAFNDNPFTTREQVLIWFDSAIDFARRHRDSVERAHEEVADGR